MEMSCRVLLLFFCEVSIVQVVTLWPDTLVFNLWRFVSLFVSLSSIRVLYILVCTLFFLFIPLHHVVPIVFGYPSLLASDILRWHSHFLCSDVHSSPFVVFTPLLSMGISVTKSKSPAMTLYPLCLVKIITIFVAILSASAHILLVRIPPMYGGVYQVILLM